MPLSTVIPLLPQFFQYMLDRYDFLHDPIKVHKIKVGIFQGTIEAATDGSLLRSTNRGSHGIALCVQDDRNNTIEGGAGCPTSPFMSSLTTEHYGLLSLGVLLHLIVSTTFTPADYSRVKSMAPIPVYIDNQTLVKRVKQLVPIRLSLKSHTVPDYDLWELTNAILQDLPFRLKCTWVKSHQDDTTVPTDLETPAFLNVAADHQAASAQRRQGTTQEELKPFLSQSVISYYDSAGGEIMDLYQHLATKLHSQSMTKYLQDKFQWTAELQSCIDWPSLKAAMKALPMPQRLKQLQYLYNWQNVGQQKVLFASSTAASESRPQSMHAIDEIGTCPMQCGHQESHGHYLLCNSAPATVARNTSIATLRHQLEESKTCPGLITWITRALLGEESSLTVQDSSVSYFDAMGAHLLNEQSQMGWDALRKGFLSQYWRKIQATYVCCELQTTTFDLDSWASNLVKYLFHHGRMMWEVRNASIHGATQVESRSVRLTMLRKRVRQLYNHPDRKYIPHNHRKTYFGLPVLQRCKQGLYALTSWIQFVERRLHFHREEAMKRTIHAWLEKT